MAVEIHSEGDEAYEKLPFYAKLGVPEVWVIDKDTKFPEVYELRGKEYELVESGKDGWILSKATGLELRATGSGKLSIRLAGDDSTREELPEE